MTTLPGGSVEHWNEEAGYVRMHRFKDKFKKIIWINPYPKDAWAYTTSTNIVRDLIEDQMYPLTCAGWKKACGIWRNRPKPAMVAVR